jgi:serine O-acetyltransferase
MRASWGKWLSEDFDRALGDENLDRGLIVTMGAAVTHPGLTAVALMRLQLALYRRGVPYAPWLLRFINVVMFGMDVCLGAAVGPGLVVPHPNGVVIGSGATVGARCRILQQVTLGETLTTDGRSGGYPTIGDDVVIGTGAKVLGPIKIGSGCIIGAGAIVTKDMPENCVVAGVPARVLRTLAESDRVAPLEGTP